MPRGGGTGSRPRSAPRSRRRGSAASPRRSTVARITSSMCSTCRTRWYACVRRRLQVGAEHVEPRRAHPQQLQRDRRERVSARPGSPGAGAARARRSVARAPGANSRSGPRGARAPAARQTQVPLTAARAAIHSAVFGLGVLPTSWRHTTSGASSSSHVTTSTRRSAQPGSSSDPTLSCTTLQHCRVHASSMVDCDAGGAGVPEVDVRFAGVRSPGSASTARGRALGVGGRATLESRLEVHLHGQPGRGVEPPLADLGAGLVTAERRWCARGRPRPACADREGVGAEHLQHALVLGDQVVDVGGAGARAGVTRGGAVPGTAAGGRRCRSTGSRCRGPAPCVRSSCRAAPARSSTSRSGRTSTSASGGC